MWRVHPTKDGSPRYYRLVQQQSDIYRKTLPTWDDHFLVNSSSPWFLLHLPNCVTSIRRIYPFFVWHHMSHNSPPVNLETKDRSRCLRESCSYSGGFGFFNGEGSRDPNANWIQGTFQQAKPSSPYEEFAKEQIGWNSWLKLILKTSLERTKKTKCHHFCLMKVVGTLK